MSAVTEILLEEKVYSCRRDFTQGGAFGDTRWRYSHSSYSQSVAFQPVLLVSDEPKSEMSFKTLLQIF